MKTCPWCARAVNECACEYGAHIGHSSSEPFTAEEWAEDRAHLLSIIDEARRKLDD